MPRRSRPLSLWRALPPTLATLFAVCLALPFWSLAVHGLPSGGAPATVPAFAALAAFWILPLTLAVLIAARSLATLPVFVLEALLLATTAVLDGGSAETRVLRLALLATMALLTPILVRRDLLFPFLTRSRTAFRKHPRVPANRGAQRIGRDGTRHPVVLQDVSLSGLAVSGPSAAFADLSCGDARGDTDIETTIEGAPFTLRARLTWRYESGLVASAGFSLVSPATLAPLVADVAREAPGSAIGRHLEELFTHPAAAWAARLVWALALLGSVGFPA